MKRNLLFVTSNDLKFMVAAEACQEFGITIRQDEHDFIEIQADNGGAIARHKANAAFRKLQTPLVVSDDSWVIPGLNGFPGPYMKNMNEWLTPDDFLNLTRNLEDRRIILRQDLVYQDASGQTPFTSDIDFQLLKVARGDHAKFPHLTISSLDGVHSLAEAITSQGSYVAGRQNAWHSFGAWYSKLDRQ